MLPKACHTLSDLGLKSWTGRVLEQSRVNNLKVNVGERKQFEGERFERAF